MREREKKKRKPIAQLPKRISTTERLKEKRVKALKTAEKMLYYYIEICVETVRMLGSCSLTVPGNNNKDLASVTAAVSAAAAAAAAVSAAAAANAAAAAIHT